MLYQNTCYNSSWWDPQMFMSKKMSFLRKPQNVMPMIRNDFAVFRNFIESLLIKLAMRLLGLIKYKLTVTC